VLFHAELVEADNEATQRLKTPIELTYLNDMSAQNFVCRKFNGMELDLGHLIKYDLSQMRRLSKKKSLRKHNKVNEPSMRNGLWEKLDGERFLWKLVERAGLCIIMIEAASSVMQPFSL